jgi:hypothetical protein
MKWRLGILLALAALLTDPAASKSPPEEISDLQQLYARRDFFTLRESLERLGDLEADSAEIGLLRAATAQAFNQPERSNEILADLLSAEGLEIDIRLRALELQMTNHLRRHRYGAALAAATDLLSRMGPEPENDLAENVRSKIPLLEALENVPPQETEISGPTRLALGQTRRVPLKIEGSKYDFAMDTGANFSVIRRSEAIRLGLEIRPTDLVISTSTARKITGDVAVAGQVEIGKIRYRHVVFLVLPDEVLTFPDGQTIAGLVGFPLIEAMGEVRFRRDDVMEIPQNPPKRKQQNLALNDLDPLVSVRYRKNELLCRLDTGAGDTVFYEPFYRRFQDRLETSGHHITATATGVGGAQQIPAIRLPRLALTVASAGINLRRVEVYTTPIRPPKQNFLDCNLGLDAFDRFRAYTISFRDMALVLK